MSKTDTTPELEHSECLYSTSIAGHLTAGQGKLDEYGHFEIPCIDCAAAMTAKLTEKMGRMMCL